VTAITYACGSLAPLELVQLMITTAKLDSRKRCPLAIASNAEWTALHWAAMYHSDSAVLELLIHSHPLAMSTNDNNGRTPLNWVVINSRPATIVSLLCDATNALADRDYAAFAARVHGDVRTIRFLSDPEYARRIAPVLFVCCLKHSQSVTGTTRAPALSLSSSDEYARPEIGVYM